MNAMTKTEWEEAYKELDKAYNELSDHEHNYLNGSNKKIRAAAERQMGYVKHRIKYLLRKYPEVYDMATGGEGVTDYSRAIIANEFFDDRYVVRDLSNLLLSMGEKIKSFEPRNTGKQ